MSANCSSLTCAGNDQLGTADIEIIAAAAAQIHHLESGLVLAVPQLEAALFERGEQLAVDHAALGGRELIGALQQRIGKRGRQQVAILERDAFRIDRVDALRFLQAHHISLAALDDGDVGAVRLQFLRHVMAAGAGAEHQNLAALPLLGVLEIAGMHLACRRNRSSPAVPAYSGMLLTPVAKIRWRGCMTRVAAVRSCAA